VTSSGAIGVVAVVVPARDEAERIGECLRALVLAARRLGSSGRLGARAALRVRTIVVLDVCTDRSAWVAAGHPGVELVHCRAGRVGAARAAGVAHVLRTEVSPPERIWIATTDADSTVPVDWLSHQVELAEQGAALFRGLVEPDARDCDRSAYRAWSDSYHRGPDHPHVHGANLGVRGDAYLACGGFDAFAAADEDVALVRRARELTLPIVASAGAVVTTSGRLVGRVPAGGFAEYLAGRAG
jgi:hypothetical protein